MRTLSVTQVRSLARMLPGPLAVYTSKEARFEVYKAKDILNPFWRDPTVKTLLLGARSSYSRYGNRFPLDDYDKKAAIYLVRASYTHATEPSITTVEEWLSVRMAPGNGDPRGGGELEMYFHQGKPMDFWLQQRFFPKEGVGFWNYVVSSSRMCGIHPHVVSQPSRGRELVIELGPKHRYTAACFAIIHAQFLVDYPMSEFPYQYITAIIREDLKQKALRISKREENFWPTFTPAYEILGLKDRSEVKLNRSEYAYEYPSYWLDISQLLDLLRLLLSEGRLKKTSLKRYLRFSLEKREAMVNLGALLTAHGPIAGSEITGAELRELVDEEVEDVPELKITKTEDWNRGILRLLDAAETDFFEQNPPLRRYL